MNKEISLKSSEIRQKFLNFFSEKNHRIVSSAPVVNKDDPTLMFTNAGMNQFKDNFLGTKNIDHQRVANTQKCLRVSGKHNDLEEVGVDSYHHTLFEMLGNWSFGDYFKKEAIEWAWELLTEVYGIDPNRLYVSVFQGDASDGVSRDNEAAEIWGKILDKERILDFDKKDNFWEMGETGPCGPCSEIHIDLRDDNERAKVEGASLVNMDHPEVIEIWNLVFIQYDRKVDGNLVPLPARHVDTGMGFERLCMVLQNKKSSYDTDVFSPIIQKIEELSGKKYKGVYGKDAGSDVAFRVIADHVRAVSFTIADGALPSNTGAGYVIRRILRRAVRYYYSFLEMEEPMIWKLVAVLADQFKEVFPELHAQLDLVSSVIKEEEKSFLKTLSDGLKRFKTLEPVKGRISGKDAFELYDTYGFPFDLTALLATESGLSVDETEFEKALNEQRERSRADAKRTVGDWEIVSKSTSSEFVGYHQLTLEEVRILRYRITEQKNEQFIHIVLDRTPFYPEGGGQVGDTGELVAGANRIKVIDTFRENELIVHRVDKLPTKPEMVFSARVDAERRADTQRNHSATHLLHAALRKVLGTHVQQKGSLVAPDQLRFDFSHFQKVSKEELQQIEKMVNSRVRMNIPLLEEAGVSIETAKERGAMMLFGEKYGDEVRVISFDPSYSSELCGGCHVQATGEIGTFKIVQETSVASGIRRIVALTGKGAENYINDQIEVLNQVKDALKNPPNIVEAIDSFRLEIKQLKSELDKANQEQAGNIQSELKAKVRQLNNVNFLAEKLSIADSKALKTMVFNLETELSPAVIAIAADVEGKPQLMIAISKSIAKDDLHAGKLIKEAASHIRGGGGGQPFFASAGGSHVGGLENAVEFIREKVEGLISE